MMRFSIPTAVLRCARAQRQRMVLSLLLGLLCLPSVQAKPGNTRPAQHKEQPNNREESNSPPVISPNGQVQFVYGQAAPTLVCAVLQICDVALQAGEQVNSIHLGDATRWLIEPALTGHGEDETQHLIIKPVESGLQTSLVVTTSRRVYHLRLQSETQRYMAQVAFSYPEDSQQRWEALRHRAVRERKAREQQTLPSSGEYLGDLSFRYEVRGEAAWKPIRVYNDGRKTIIELPAGSIHQEAPALLLWQTDGEGGEATATGLVNYRVQGTRYIVDSVFERAVLIAGTGSQQQRIEIERKP